MNAITKYLYEVQRAMDLTAAHEKVIFVGQAVRYPGHAITRQVEKYPDAKKIEFPVAEEFQAGFCLGLALEGYIPFQIYPRFDFAILALNQLINHLDKWVELTKGQSKPKVITKICVGSVKPLHPGPQHSQNHTSALKKMCSTIEVIELKTAKSVYPAYEKALYREDGRSTILVEHSDKYAHGRLFKWK
jgi:pyruvate/2-oxoglutarate/acetoin dehydrogenase E1 component